MRNSIVIVVLVCLNNKLKALVYITTHLLEDITLHYITIYLLVEITLLYITIHLLVDSTLQYTCLWALHYLTLLYYLLVDITLHYIASHHITLQYTCLWTLHYFTSQVTCLWTNEPSASANALYSSPRLHPASRIACGQIFPQMHLSLQ